MQTKRTALKSIYDSNGLTNKQFCCEWKLSYDVAIIRSIVGITPPDKHRPTHTLRHRHRSRITTRVRVRVQSSAGVVLSGLDCTPNASIKECAHNASNAAKSIVFSADFSFKSIGDRSRVDSVVSQVNTTQYNWAKTCAAIALIIRLYTESEANSNYRETRSAVQCEVWVLYRRYNCRIRSVCEKLVIYAVIYSHIVIETVA